jgi:hypothetical protein
MVVAVVYWLHSAFLLLYYQRRLERRILQHLNIRKYATNLKEAVHSYFCIFVDLVICALS